VKAVLRAMTKLSRMRESSVVVFGDALGEIVLSRIAGEIGEGEHHDRKMAGLRRLHQMAAEGKPAAGGGQKQKRGGSGERGEGRASFGRRLRLIGWRRRSGLTRRTELQRVGPHRLGDVLQRHGAEIADLQIEPPLDLPEGVVGEADPSGLGDQPASARRY
jgi:hypothetical protein